MTYEQLVASIGIAAIVTVLVEVVKRAGAWTSEQAARFAPLLAVVLGAVLGGVLFVVAPVEVRTGQDIIVAVLFGLMQGAGAVGLYNIGGKTVFEAVAGPAAPPSAPSSQLTPGHGPASPSGS